MQEREGMDEAAALSVARDNCVCSVRERLAGQAGEEKGRVYYYLPGTNRRQWISGRRPCTVPVGTVCTVPASSPAAEVGIYERKKIIP